MDSRDSQVDPTSEDHTLYRHSARGTVHRREAGEGVFSCIQLTEAFMGLRGPPASAALWFQRCFKNLT
eukprot:34719-Amphidinium_carterae.1